MLTTLRFLSKWWAQYLESIGELNQALNHYDDAKDHFAAVRLYAFMGNLNKAAEVATESGDKAACYHLAKQYEMEEKYKEAVQFYGLARAYSSAIR